MLLKTTSAMKAAAMLLLVGLFGATATEVRVISYNMAGGAKRNNDNILSKKESFYTFAEEFASLYNAEPEAEWILCLQEMNRDDDTYYYGPDGRSKNMVDKLQEILDDRTGVKWYKNSHTQPAPGGILGGIVGGVLGLYLKEAVATFSTSKISKVQRKQWMLAGGRPALATKIDIPGQQLWVVNAHLDSGSHGNRRKGVDKMLDNIDTFYHTVPVVVAGDFNVPDSDPRVGGTRVGDEEEFDETMQKFIDEGYTRGDNFVPSQDVGTFKPWFTGSKSIIDYVLMDEKHGTCTMYDSTTLTFRNDHDGHASDHHGVMTKIECP